MERIGVSARLALAVISGLVATSAVAAAATAAPRVHIEELRVDSAAVQNSGSALHLTASPNPCQDGTYRLLGGSQPKGSYSWSFNASSTPSSLTKSGVLAVLKKSFSNVTGVNNDCGLPDNVSATHTYLGKTSTRAKCDSRDSRNVIGFRRLEFGVLATTCYWTNNGRIVEADMQITTREDWALSEASCLDQMLLEATITHEAGHVFGLAHVSERRHGRLTMSPYIDGYCNNNEATLGWGDVRGLEALY